MTVEPSHRVDLPGRWEVAQPVAGLGQAHGRSRDLLRPYTPQADVGSPVATGEESTHPFASLLLEIWSPADSAGPRLCRETVAARVAG